MIFAFILLQF